LIFRGMLFPEGWNPVARLIIVAQIMSQRPTAIAKKFSLVEAEMSGKDRKRKRSRHTIHSSKNSGPSLYQWEAETSRRGKETFKEVNASSHYRLSDDEETPKKSRRRELFSGSQGSRDIVPEVGNLGEGGCCDFDISQKAKRKTKVSASNIFPSIPLC
jgi:hypothetical protein